MKQVTKTSLKFVIGFALVLVLSAFLAPLIYALLPLKFDRILRRLIMVGSVLLVLWLVRSRRESLGRLGLGWRRGSARLLGAGFLSGILIVAVISLAQMGLGARFWYLSEKDGWHWIGFFLKGLSGGLLIGAIEEFFFRGFLFLTLKDLWSNRASLVVTNLIYAMVHFFPKHKPFTGPAPTPWDSFRILGAFLPSFFDKPEIILGLLGLFLFGLILSFAFLRANSLYLPIGIHAGCVFSLRLNRRFVPEIAERMGIWSGGKNLYDGVLGLAVLGIFALLLGRGVKYSSQAGSRRRGTAPLLLACIFLASFPARLLADEPTGPPKEIFYSFLQELSRARAAIKGEGQVFRGEWGGDRIQFKGFPRETEILLSERIPVKGKTRPVIRLTTLGGFETELVFSKVPVRRHLRLFFALPDAALSKGEIVPVQFGVWIGEKKLYETAITSAGWHEKTLDLTLPYLLQRSYRFTFRLRASGKNPRSLVFYGYME